MPETWTAAEAVLVTTPGGLFDTQSVSKIYLFILVLFSPKENNKACLYTFVITLSAEAVKQAATE